ncbi:hypothetical protein FVE85_3011 [Porphyridium purpureum]|uniref:Uncharacterized protein n=1 Tax=Porphyridium purpureum TaxID=35688 RepID=A0A5J4YUY5_PORPP|nr:hypothetical protein FVE85_3011 [Porphyridium purpureum]|eukprot:POR8314..scf227_4
MHSARKLYIHGSTVSTVTAYTTPFGFDVLRDSHVRTRQVGTSVRSARLGRYGAAACAVIQLVTTWIPRGALSLSMPRTRMIAGETCGIRTGCCTVQSSKSQVRRRPSCSQKSSRCG